MTSVPRLQRGLSMIELMVGVTIALFLTAVGGALLVGQLRESRALLLETRLTQDLRTTVDLIVRDLRRAGYWGHAGAGANPYAFTAAAAPSDTVSLRYSIDAAENDIADSTEQFGFRLRGGAIEAQLGAGNWQALTDPGSLTVNAFSVTPEVQEISLAPACTQQQRDVTVVVSAALASDARITRTVRTRVRVRSNTLVGTCPF